MASINVVEANLDQAEHQTSTLELLNAYSMDPMGDGKPLADATYRNVITGLREHPTTMIFLAYHGEIAVGIAICFRGFSTFAARPLINIHDFYVVPAFRGSGIGRNLLGAIERRARELGCCKLTLEVQENNRRARAIYTAAGFAQGVYVAEAGGTLYLMKPL